MSEKPWYHKGLRFRCTGCGDCCTGEPGFVWVNSEEIQTLAEAIGLAVMTELPLIVVNVQRGGPSTGLPTKIEQTDLFQAMYGRNGECPVAVLAPCSPADCFAAAIEAARLAIRFMIPVIVLSDGYLANGAEPWRIPNPDEIPPFEAPTPAEHEDGVFSPYQLHRSVKRLEQ